MYNIFLDLPIATLYSKVTSLVAVADEGSAYDLIVKFEPVVLVTPALSPTAVFQNLLYLHLKNARPTAVLL
jgi:hypothetical protein